MFLTSSGLSWKNPNFKKCKSPQLYWSGKRFCTRKATFSAKKEWEGQVDWNKKTNSIKESTQLTIFWSILKECTAQETEVSDHRLMASSIYAVTIHGQYKSMILNSFAQILSNVASTTCLRSQLQCIQPWGSWINEAGHGSSNWNLRRNNF